MFKFLLVLVWAAKGISFIVLLTDAFVEMVHGSVLLGVLKVIGSYGFLIFWNAKASAASFAEFLTIPHPSNELVILRMWNKQAMPLLQVLSEMDRDGVPDTNGDIWCSVCGRETVDHKDCPIVAAHALLMESKV